MFRSKVRQNTQDPANRVLLVNKFYPPKAGGVETVVRQHGRFLSCDGFDVTVLCVSDRRSFRTRVELLEGIRVVRCASLGTFFSMPISLVFPLWLWLLGPRNDLICFHLPFPLGTLSGLLLPRRVLKLVVWHSDIIRQRFFGRLMRPFQGILCRQAVRILTTSENLARSSQVISRFRQKVGVVPISVSNPRISEAKDSDCPAEAAASGNISRPFGLYLGRLCYYKGIDVFVRALDRLPVEDRHFPMVIAGAGPMANEIADALKTCTHSAVTFIPRFIERDEKEWLLQNAAFFVFPSTEPSEAFGIMQLEAMLMGLPVINTQLPTGVPWVSIDGVSGLTVSPGDPDSLARAISFLIREPSARRRLGNGAAERARTLFSEERVRILLRSEIRCLFAVGGP